MKRILFAVAPLLSAPLLSQAAVSVEFTEALIDPVGPNAGAQRLELRSRANPAADLTGWFLVTPVGAYALPSVMLPYGGIAVVHLGQAGTSTALDIYMPTVPELGLSSSIALFRSSATNVPAEMADFVSWGGGQNAIATAVLAGQWSSLQGTVPLPGVQGHTIAHYDEVSYGQRNRPEAWFADGTPTLGASNDGGGIFGGGFGCPQIAYPPQIGSAAENNRPWIGEAWRLDVGYLPPVPSTLFVAFGTSVTGPIPLDSFGIPGCYFEVMPDGILVAGMPPSIGALLLHVPNDPGFVGLELLLQGLAFAPGANAANWLPTRVLHAHIGSR